MNKNSCRNSSNRLTYKNEKGTSNQSVRIWSGSSQGYRIRKIRHKHVAGDLDDSSAGRSHRCCYSSEQDHAGTGQGVGFQ
nr:MAG TPA: hypothetical protein [Caudoviricetes sp.]